MGRPQYSTVISDFNQSQIDTIESAVNSVQTSVTAIQNTDLADLSTDVSNIKTGFNPKEANQTYTVLNTTSTSLVTVKSVGSGSGFISASFNTKDPDLYVKLVVDGITLINEEKFAHNSGESHNALEIPLIRYDSSYSLQIRASIATTVGCGLVDYADA